MIDTNIDFIIEGDTIDLVTDFGQTVTEYIRPEEYTGQTTVTPSTTQQILETADRHVSENITVEGVPLGILDVTENGRYFPVHNTLGFSEVDVNVQPVLEKLTVTANGTFRPDEGVDGFNEVVVDNPTEWTTNGVINMSEPNGDLIITSDVDIVNYGMCKRLGITSLKFTSENPVFLGEHAFDGGTNIKDVFVNRLGLMGYYAFAYCSELLAITIKNANGATIGNYICRNTKCNTIKINGTPETMNENVLRLAPNVRDVYVSWAEGEVENAPWNKTSSAVIHYNTVFDNDMNVISSD